MIGPIAQTSHGKQTDAGIHTPILDAINFTKTAAATKTEAKLAGLGLDESAINAALGSKVGKSYAAIFKANPYHDGLGRFATGNGAAFVSTTSHFEKTLTALRKQVKATETADAAKEYIFVKQNNPSLQSFARAMTEETQASWDKLSEAEKLSIKEYSSSFHEPINQGLGGQQAASEKLDAANKHIDNMDKAMETMASPKDMIVFRAVNVSRLMGVGADISYLDPVDLLHTLKGKIFEDPCFGSTSVHHRIATDFLSDSRVMLGIQVPKGAKGIWVGGSTPYTGLPKRVMFGSEMEFILPRGRVYKVTGAKRININGDEHTVLSVQMLNPTGPTPVKPLLHGTDPIPPK